MPQAVFVPARWNDLAVDVNVGSPAQGAVAYFGGSFWNALPAGTSGQFLKTQGAGANPVWASLPAGTFATLSDVTLTSPAQGDVYYRNAAGNVVNLGHGTAGQVLTTGGAAANPSWTTPAAGSVSPDLILTRAGAATPADPKYFTITPGADTALTASTEANDVLWSLNRTQQFATGALTNQRAVWIRMPTYSFVGASTITNAVTLAIEGAPVAGTNATITNAYALRVAAGLTGLMGGVTSPGAGTSSELFGLGAAAGGNFSVAFGGSASAAGLAAAAVGNLCVASAISCIAVGQNAQATATNAIAIGSSALANSVGAMAVGSNTQATNASAFAFGSGSNASGNNAFALGAATMASGPSSMAMGVNTTTDGNGTIAIGGGASTTGTVTASIALGRVATSGASYQFVVGECTSGFYIKDVYLGGVTGTTPQPISLNANGASGTNVAGANLTLAAGKSTGSAKGGDVLIQTSPAGGGGGTLNALATLAQFTGDSKIGVFGVTPVVRQTGGAATAGSTYTSAEQGMINSIWTALRAYGWLT